MTKSKLETRVTKRGAEKLPTYDASERAKWGSMWRGAVLLSIKAAPSESKYGRA